MTALGKMSAVQCMCTYIWLESKTCMAIYMATKLGLKS